MTNLFDKVKAVCALVVMGLGLAAYSAAPTVTSVTAQQRYPWNGLVDIAVTFNGEQGDVVKATCTFAATNSATKTALAIAHVTPQGNDTGLGTTWTRRFIWDTNADLGEVKIDDIELVVDVETTAEGAVGSGGVQLWEGGPYWAECNVGASKPEESGLYFWWGDTEGHAGDWYFDFSHCPTYGKSISELLSLGYIDSTGNLAPAYDTATVHLGAPWRMPTDAEFDALISHCDATWTTRNGVNGRLVQGRGVYASKCIFLPAAGCGYVSGLLSLGSFGYFWSSTPDSDDSDRAWNLRSNSSDFDRRSSTRFYGRSVRPVRGFAQSTHMYSVCLSLDNRTGVRIVNAPEQICFSPAWDTEAAGATAVVSVNGEVVKNATADGVYEWTPAADGIYQLTHAVFANGVQVGETLTATFARGIEPRGCDWTTGTIELGWYADAKSLDAVTYSIYWSESDDPASCVGKEDHLAGTKVFSPSKIGVQELTISDVKYLTHGDGLKPIYYHVVGSDGYQSCSRRMRNRHGLFVGIDKYEDPALLELGCCNDDAQKWRDMYTANLGASNPRLMTDSDCTKEAVLGALGDFAEEAQVGDVFLYTHSGHGDTSLLRCYDSRKSNASSNISATEFANALKQFRKGVGVVVVLDACSSGSIPSNMNVPRLLMASKSNSVQDESASRSFAESVISAMDASKKYSRLLMSAAPATLQSSPTDERIASGSEIGWLTAVNETEDSVDGVFSGDCLQTAGWIWGGADRNPFGNDDTYVDFGELGRFAKYWCDRMYDQYEMSPQMYSEEILGNIRAGRVTYRNSEEFLAAPQNVVATMDRNDGIEVTWDPVTGASDYWICFSDGENELHDVFTEGNRYMIQPTEDCSVAFGQPFQIYVKAWNPMDVSERSSTVIGVRSALMVTVTPREFVLMEGESTVFDVTLSEPCSKAVYVYLRPMNEAASNCCASLSYSTISASSAGLCISPGKTACTGQLDGLDGGRSRLEFKPVVCTSSTFDESKVLSEYEGEPFELEVRNVAPELIVVGWGDPDQIMSVAMGQDVVIRYQVRDVAADLQIGVSVSFAGDGVASETVTVTDGGLHQQVVRFTTAGTHAVRITAKDKDGASASRTLYFSVQPQEPEGPAHETEMTPVPVPFEVIEAKYKHYLDAAGGDYEAAALAVGRNGYAIWECYVAGLEPDDQDSKFKIVDIKFEDGELKVMWSPDLNENGTKNVRKYTEFGRKKLGGTEAWTDMKDVNPAEKNDYKFRKVTVDMP